MPNRIIGFDVARAYAIFGMFIVNFNFCFGSFQNSTYLGKFLNLFIGNSTAIFIVCAGMGVSLMTGGFTKYAEAEKEKYKSIILKRSWVLFVLGLSLYNWWPGDILHFYGGYMHIAAFIIFVPRRYYLASAILAIIIFHVLLFIIPIFTGWDLSTFKYADFWTVKGFLRNTLYNGWNSIFPWFAYFGLGMWLGRIDWNNTKIRKRIFLLAIAFFLLFETIRIVFVRLNLDRQILDYVMFDYFPPYLPFMIITASFALIVISICIWLGEKFSKSVLLQFLSDTGKMTLTNYVQHLTIGMLILQWLSGRKYTGLLQTGTPVPSLYILIYSVVYFIITVIASRLWLKKFGRGPLELLMRKFSG